VCFISARVVWKFAIFVRVISLLCFPREYPRFAIYRGQESRNSAAPITRLANHEHANDESRDSPSRCGSSSEFPGNLSGRTNLRFIVDNIPSSSLRTNKQTEDKSRTRQISFSFSPRSISQTCPDELLGSPTWNFMIPTARASDTLHSQD